MSKLDIQTTQDETPQHPFEKGLKLYEQKAPLEQVIALFEQGLLLSPKDSTGYTCLAWLYLLRQAEGDNVKALSYAQKAVKLDQTNYQAHFNLVLSMLVNKVKGIRAEFLKALNKCKSQEDLQEVIENLNEALERRPDFSEAAKILTWIKEQT